MQARLKCATYPRSEYMVIWAVDRLRRYERHRLRHFVGVDQSIGKDETNTFQLKFYI